MLEGTVYVQITRGVAPRRHAFPKPAVPPTELIIVQPYDEVPTVKLRETGVALISHVDERWKRCDVKSTNLLANCLANEAAHREGAYEAVLIDDRGHVTEATHSSVLWVRDGQLGGTPESNEILPGTTRGVVLRLARAENLPFQPGTITRAELMAADEVFLVGTTIEILPVVRIDGLPIADGLPGPITRRLQAAFKTALDEWLAQGSPTS